MTLEEQIRRIAEESLTDRRHFLVDVVLTARKGPKKVLVIVEGDEGVNIDDCALISRSVSQKLEDSGILGEESYILEVSTPGLDQPLKLKRQYQRNVGRKLKVKVPGSVVEGKLEAVTSDSITLLAETGTAKKTEIKSLEIRFDQIEKAFVLVSFK